MRDEHDPVTPRELADVIKRREDLDVRVEIHRRVGTAAEQQLEQPRLDRRGELSDLVDRCHLPELGRRERQLGWSDQIERLAGRVERRTHLPVDDQHADALATVLGRV